MSHEVRATIASLGIGNGNLVAGQALNNLLNTSPESRIDSSEITLHSPLTAAAALRQTSITMITEFADHYTNHQEKYRESKVAHLLGLLSLMQLLHQTPKLRPGSHDLSALILTGELPYAATEDLYKTFASRFTHLFLLVADESPKLSAQKVIDKSHSSARPITSIVWSRSAHTSNPDSLLVAPWIVTPDHRPNKPTMSFLKTSGTDMDIASQIGLMQALSRHPYPLCIMYPELTTRTIMPDGHSIWSHQPNLPTQYQLFAKTNPIIAAHASEMVQVSAILRPKELHLAKPRGPHEDHNAKWIAEFYEQFYLPNILNDNILHLRKTMHTEDQLATSVGATSAARVIYEHMQH